MAWRRVMVSLAADQAEAFADALLEAGALSASIEQDRSAGQAEHALFGEPDMPEAGLWPDCLVDALLPLEAVVADVVAAASDLAGLPQIPAWTGDTVADQDWVRATQSQFDPIAIAQGLWIVPTWHEPPDASAINLRLDPGQAFGTGSHPTTRLCLQWLAEHRPGGTVLDYGCGSGILAIAARMLGASRAVGVDLDPAAVQTAQDNARANGVDASFGLPDLAAAQGQFDVVVANILTRPLIMLAPLLLARLRPGGYLVLSGILERQAAEVIQAYGGGAVMRHYGAPGEWVCLTGIRGAPKPTMPHAGT
ncbi:MAG: 50S ribosomal protein L11 methyltransferase [Pseudomonadota bacterium]|nr:50S ribosomal protein L11 methyltransferase [Pseudomonadota bacterium]